MTRTRGKLGLILFIAVVSLFSGCQKAAQNFEFVFMTDIHLQPEKNAVEGFKQAIAKVNEIDPDFVITGGDLIMDALGQSYERASQLYDLYLETATDFEMPVYNTIGNHENFGLYTESGVSPEHPEYGKKMYQNRVNEALYYSFDHKGWHFIVLDAIGFTEDRRYIGEVDAAQLEWLRKDLEATGKSTPIALSMHIPLTSVFVQMRNGATEALSEGSCVTNSKQVRDILKGYKVKLVLQGHLHMIEDIFYTGTHYITGGAVSGSWWNGPRFEFPEGFVVVSVRGDDMTWRYETFGWQAVPE